MFKNSLFRRSLIVISIWLIFNTWFPGNPETLIILVLLNYNYNKKVLLKLFCME